MSVKKIFMVLIVVIAMVGIGALVLNFLLPNATKAVVNAVENQIYNATGMNFDLNGDGTDGELGDDYTAGMQDSTTETGMGDDGAGVTGIN